MKKIAVLGLLVVAILSALSLGCEREERREEVVPRREPPPRGGRY